MINDALSLLQHALLLAAAWAMLRVWFAVDRVILRVSVAALFCVGEYASALLAFILLCIAESAHRAIMAKRRAEGSYNGPWID
ncbi:MAG: hypothetical protein K2X34_10025 [Hyphomonadaceae bacterium]|nr:hypothetical protein [Hyphomonadaceae bacterium]